mgnify:CR=1 FL=1
MALTEKQDIPEKPKETQEPWSFRRLFPFKATVSSLTKSFTTPFSILLVFQILIIGVSELIGKQVSSRMYILATFILIADMVERLKILPLKEEKKNGK